MSSKATVCFRIPHSCLLHVLLVCMSTDDTCVQYKDTWALSPNTSSHANEVRNASLGHFVCQLNNLFRMSPDVVGDLCVCLGLL
ncbi:hypothetical protein CEXT_20251 [Caerostris extrusa]|uniref:Secreted protein n=1 Tax=Caerostris extrusa TaxID=172846 RepID=A0AAV4PTU9_CAEEX|nr:hypothetical protein CEXT_20251 [Caerostris extrusa]